MPFLPILAKTAAVIGGTMLACTAIAYSGGVVDVCVKEKKGDRTHIHLPLPALAGPVAISFIPARNFSHSHHESEQLRDFLPAIRIAARELERVPNGTVLVDVQDDHETVHISKEGGDLVIDVDNRDETVHISFPIRMAVTVSSQVADKMERSKPTI